MDKETRKLIEELNSWTEDQLEDFRDYLQSDEYIEQERLRHKEEEKQWYESIETPQTEVEVVNKTIIITDPCYISDGECEDWKDDYAPYIVKNTIYGDWSCSVYKGSKEEVEDIIEAWDQFYIPWWEAINRKDLTSEEKDVLEEKYQKKSAEYKEKYLIGNFCADAGMVAVYDADKIPAEKLQWCKEHDWCACFIENYTGPIKYVTEEHIAEDGHKYKTAHIVGNCFYTSQSGF